MTHTRFGEVLVVVVAAVLSLLSAMPLISGLRETRTLIPAGLSPEDAKAAILQLSPEALAQLEAREKARLAKEPVDVSALTNLALIANLSHQNDEAAQYSITAANRSLRDPVTQLIAIAVYLKKADYSQAFYHVDAALSTSPALSEQLYPALDNTLSDGAAVKRLGEVLAQNTLWRADFMNWLAKGDETGQKTFAVLAAIRAANGSVSDTENRALISQQIQQKNYDRGYFYWLDSLTASQLAKAGNLYDGDFQFEPANDYFGWNILPSPSIDISFDAPQNDKQGRKLRLNFINNEQPFNGVFQFLHLAPGNYTLAGEWSSSQLKTPSGLVWSVQCIESAEVAGRSTPFSAPTSTVNFSFTITVPQQNCDFQNLKLINASPAVLDAKISGEYVFSGLDIKPQS